MKENMKVRVKHYSNATTMKLLNKRVHVERVKDRTDILGLYFKKLEDSAEEQPANKTVVTQKGRVTTTKFVLSIEACEALFYALGNELRNMQIQEDNKRYEKDSKS